MQVNSKPPGLTHRCGARRPDCHGADQQLLPEWHALVRNFNGHRQGPENNSCFRSVASSRQPIVTGCY